MVAAKIGWSSVWNLVHVALLEPRILRWLIDVWNMCVPLGYYPSILFQCKLHLLLGI